jgi:hypothetical protein
MTSPVLRRRVSRRSATTFPSVMHTTPSAAFTDSRGYGHQLKSVEIDLWTPGWSLADFQAIRNKGFDAIRVTMHWRQVQPTSSTAYDAAQLTALANYLTFCETVGLYVTLDPIHCIGSANAPPGYTGAALVGGGWDNIPAWAPIAGERVTATISRVGILFIRHLIDLHGHRPVFVGYDINEPPSPSNNLTGQDLVLSMYEAVRADRGNSTSTGKLDKILIISSGYGDQKITGANATLLKNKANVAFALHYYYGGDGSTSDGYSTTTTSKVGTSSDSPATSPGAVVVNPTLEAHFLVAYNWCKAAGIPLVIWEFACHMTYTNRAAWITEMVRIFNEYHVPRNWWEWYSSNQGLALIQSDQATWNSIAELLV